MLVKSIFDKEKKGNCNKLNQMKIFEFLFNNDTNTFYFLH